MIPTAWRSRVWAPSLRLGMGRPFFFAAGVAAALFTLGEQFIPPTLNYETPDPECELDVTPNKGAQKKVEHVLCNTLAFGSKNSALVLRRGQ
ncbi:MAG: hypothetical protein HYZ52_03600 [Candidatus Omnitrophica bacterium]|nr:hypothetical protein [Candidatus Omnitrophota bacterium]